MSLFCEYSSLITESDVEQKFIFQMLTSPAPMGLGIDSRYILTKNMLRQKLIGKGQTKKYYFPDYLISIRGIPVMVIEAKEPNEPLGNAFSEARLYAAEVNAHFEHNINACQYIVVSNGTETWAGYSDQAEPVVKVRFDNISTENKDYVEFLGFCALDKLNEIANRPYRTARGNSKFYTPVSKIGGSRVQNEELEENSFGRTFIFENRRIFDPETEEDRAVIVKNAYVPSAKREQHIEPMYKEIRKFQIPGTAHTTALPTESPDAMAQSISKRIEQRDEAYSLLLLVGNVGSGKTTFVRYFQKVYLAQEHANLAKRCDWVFVNMNTAPLSRDEIYPWLKSEITMQLKANHPDINFASFDIIQRVFRRDISDFEIGIGCLLGKDTPAYKQALFELLKENQHNDLKYLQGLLDFLKESYGIVPIVVLDNSDKRNKDEQLLMFEVAQWLRKTLRCIVILPMRDSTYDQYKNEPPLDTVVKDLVFRIDPPDLLKVIQARLDYIVRTVGTSEAVYHLDNGFNVPIKKSDLIEYFKSILMVIRSNRSIANIFYRLSAHNTRNGIQIFEDFCKSGHISTNEIFSMRAMGQDYQLKMHTFMNALLRKNRRYYHDEHSNFVNLFWSSYKDDFPDPFIRVDILRWLNSRKDNATPSQFKGMYPVSDLIRDMQAIGHDAKVAHRELNTLISRGLVISETQAQVSSDTELIKITLPGRLHIELLTQITYLAACAENSLFKNSDKMMDISRRISSEYHLSNEFSTLTAYDFVHYLLDYRKLFQSSPEAYIKDNDSCIYDLAECLHALDKRMSDAPAIGNLCRALQTYVPGTQVTVTVSKKEQNRLFCIFGEEQRGYLSTVDAKYCYNEDDHASVIEGAELVCEVIEYSYIYRNFQLKYIGINIPV